MQANTTVAGRIDKAGGGAMPASETREIRQSTYTPIRSEPRRSSTGGSLGFRPVQPFFRLFAIETAFKDKETARRLIAKMRRGIPGVSKVQLQLLFEILETMWTQGRAETVKKLGKIDLEVIFRVAQHALNLRESAINAFQTPAKKSSSTSGKKLKSASASRPEQDSASVIYPLMQQLVVYQPQQIFIFLSDGLARDRQTLDALADLAKIEPVGMLHLERVTFDPVGYERGELVYSVPLTPGEVVRLVHKEWTRTEREFQSSTRTSLETEVEDAISEKSELTESVQSQRQHDTALNTAVSASGSYGSVSISASVGYNVNDSESTSRENTATRTKELTKKAASRVKQEHKISFRLTEESVTESENYRELKNESADPVRWDFHRIMKRWQVSLYRYGVRLTYDLVLPEPGSYMLRQHIRLRQIEDQLKESIPLAVTLGSLQPETWQSIAEEYDVALEPPPPSSINLSFGREIPLSQNYFAYGHIEVKVPEGYEIDPDHINAYGSGIQTEGSGRAIAYVDTLAAENGNRLRAGGKSDPAFLWRFVVDASNEEAAREGEVILLTLDITMRLSARALDSWRAKNYAKLLQAHEGRQELRRQQLEDEYDTLRISLSGTDPLVLRTMEKEEIMKGVLRFLLGPDFRFYPSRLSALDQLPDNELGLYNSETGTLRPGVSADWLRHGQIIRFLHHAIEWENVNYVMYPYFWSDTDRWDIKQKLNHEDFVHRNFLRSGAARVVLTIRPGFEDSFLSFMETADTENLLPPEHPYITIAAEMKAMAQTRYPYTPGTSVENPENLVDQWQEYTPTGALDVMRGTVLGDGS